MNRVPYIARWKHRLDPVGAWVRAKLAGMPLRQLGKSDHSDIIDGLIEEWKCSDVEMVGRVGWDCASDCSINVSVT